MIVIRMITTMIARMIAPALPLPLPDELPLEDDELDVQIRPEPLELEPPEPPPPHDGKIQPRMPRPTMVRIKMPWSAAIRRVFSRMSPFRMWLNSWATTAW